MQRIRYVVGFMFLATAFVPILINFGVIGWIVPTGWSLWSGAAAILSGHWRPAIGFLGYSAIYLGVFYGFARLSFWLFSLSASHSFCIALQSAALIGLFSCSFLRRQQKGQRVMRFLSCSRNARMTPNARCKIRLLRSLCACHAYIRSRRQSLPARSGFSCASEFALRLTPFH